MEGQAGTVGTSFAVTLSPPAGAPVTVQYATADGTATAGVDYTATAGTLTFATGSTSRLITVPVIGDTLDEADETFTVSLSNVTGPALMDDGVGGPLDLGGVVSGSGSVLRGGSVGLDRPGANMPVSGDFPDGPNPG